MTNEEMTAPEAGAIQMPQKPKEKKISENYARGDWQKIIAYRIDSGEIVRPFVETTACCAYAPLYERSLTNFIRRCKDAGIEIIYKRGPRGGRWHAEVYRADLIKKKQSEAMSDEAH